ncbi:SGNH/GDSL hydrolase family protein [Ruminiclostridium papyrosolvens]|uniref:Lysophospholipase n=1 Tax=Ruminiclostridium papyrosolvens C7 TaxID=1330534 RepID=U4R684_9FIRM|nr:SGNH/GDSL hydrolase family protein [Ruminiclostridium papyrosolvens]EPR13551.1 lysophospholipase [Ruminiclostridium papyrosolvens C7]
MKNAQGSHSKIIERSLISTGNNYRMKKAMEKAEKGQKVTLAYLGGSITEGYNGGPDKCFAKLTCDYFAQNFCKGNNINYINAGMAGTSSTLGLIRIEKDILIHKPDIVFVEFSVNDTKDKTNMAAFESLLLRILSSESQPAVVLIFTISESGYSCQNEMAQIGRHYELAMISIKDAIVPEFVGGTMNWQDYSDDYIHPHENGHELITELIIYYLNKVSHEVLNGVYKISETPVVGNEFVTLKMLDNTIIRVKDSGGFSSDITINQFPNGWTHKAGAKTEKFSFNLYCKNLFIVYKESKNTDTGSADIHIDDIFVLTVNGFNSSGWNNPVAKLLLNSEKPAIHKIEIKMSKGSEDKELSILAFGYS